MEYVWGQEWEAPDFDLIVGCGNVLLLISTVLAGISQSI